MYLNRNAENTIKMLNNEFPVIMVCGPRQVGKSTLLFHLRENNRDYISLDDLDLRRMAKTDPKMFLALHQPPIIIDEFQYAPELLTYIKIDIDQRKLNGENTNGLYWLTGSQIFNMMKDTSESLAGRCGILNLYSLTMNEIDRRDYEPFNPEIKAFIERKKSFIYKSPKDIYELIFNGGMPKVIVENVDRARYYSSYISTYIERDIKQLAQVGDEFKFLTFIEVLAARTAQELNYTAIASDVGISDKTVKHWISILESSGIIYILRPYFNNLNSRLIKTPKVYFMDTGLCTWLCKWTSAESLQNGVMGGSIFETFVVSEIVKNLSSIGTKPSLYYYRDKDKKEIDLLMVTGEHIYPIGIKKAASPIDADKNFSVLNKFNLNVKPGLIICMAEKLIQNENKNWFIPISMV